MDRDSGLLLIAFFILAMLALWMYVIHDRRDLEPWEIERLRKAPAGWIPGARYHRLPRIGLLLLAAGFVLWGAADLAEPEPYPATGRFSWLINWLHGHVGEPARAIVRCTFGGILALAVWYERARGKL
jgi:hypothetical protein